MATTKSITAEELRMIVHYNQTTGVFVWLASIGGKAKAGSLAGSRRADGYWRIQIYGRSYTAHRLAWLYMTGCWPEKLDHRNRNRADNRWENIREATPKQNAENITVRADSVSGCSGVTWCVRTGQWKARITHNGLTIHLGYHQNLRDATEARKSAEQRYFTHAASLG